MSFIAPAQCETHLLFKQYDMFCFVLVVIYNKQIVLKKLLAVINTVDIFIIQRGVLVHTEGWAKMVYATLISMEINTIDTIMSSTYKNNSLISEN